MARPLQGKEPKKDVTLTLDAEIYRRAKAFARDRRKSVSSLVDDLLEKAIASEEKKVSVEAARSGPSASSDSTAEPGISRTGSIKGYPSAVESFEPYLIAADKRSKPARRR